jgi:carbon-monoxide dehydrogenase medium subunit
MQPFEYREPATVDEALDLLSQRGEDAKVIAGGTALVIMLKQRLLAPPCLVSLRRIGALRGARVSGESLHLGALETHRAIETSPLVNAIHATMAQTYGHVATIRVRNMATVGGSLAHADPSQDPPVTLMALNGRVRLLARSGSREVPLEEFFKDYYETVTRPDELLTEVLVPLMPADSGASYIKFLPRTMDDYATVGVAAWVSVDPQTGKCRECRVAMGCVASTPVRARSAEALLRGQLLTAELLREAGRAAEDATDPISDARGSAEYKRAMAGVFTRRALQQAWQQCSGYQLSAIS